MIGTEMPPQDLHELESWLSQREAVYPDLIPGTEKKIAWCGETARQTELAVVFIHGFSASRQEVAPLPQRVASACQANLFCTRLAAHGRGPDAFGDLQPEHWLEDGVEALQIGRQLGQRVVLMGSSTGATIALWLAQQYPDIAATVLLSPNFGVATASTWQSVQHRVLRGPWGKHIARRVLGAYFTQFKPLSAAHARYWTPRYRTEGLVTLFSFLASCRAIAFERITTPCLMAYSPHDKVVDLRAMQIAFDRLASANKQLLRFAAADGHVLAGDILSPTTTQALATEVITFLHDLPATESATS